MTRIDSDRLRMAAKAVALPLAALVVAEFAAREYAQASMTVAPPSEVLRALLAAMRDGTLFQATAQTLAAALGGLLVGGAIGTSAGILMGIYAILDSLSKITVEAVRPLPSIAVIPIAMMITGVGYSLEISVVAYATVWPTMILARSAVQGIEPQLMEVAKALNLNAAQAVSKIVFPSILPRLFVALRLAAGFALIVAVTAEIVANPMGMGYAMLNAQQSMQPALMLAYLLWIGFVGWLLNHLAGAAHNRLLGHKDEK